MSKSEKIKSQIDYLKLLIIFDLSAIFAIIGWCVSSRKSLENIDLILAGFGLLVLCVVALILQRFISTKFNELGEA